MAEQHDYVALEWVKGEIEETLKQAEQALEAYVETPEDATRMRFCLTYIHQVHGTLQMVEFYGAALLAEEMEKLAQVIINKSVPREKDAQEALMQAILQLPGYLEHLQTGKQDIPVTLLPLMNDLRSSRGDSLLTETSLFSPNLLPLKVEGSYTFNSANAQKNISKLREAYKLGLLGVIRNLDVVKSYAALAKVCAHLEQLSSEAPLGRLWWILGSVVEGMSTGAIENSITVKTLLRQAEKEIARFEKEGEVALNTDVPEELAKNLLYYIAKSTSTSNSTESIKKVFGLVSALPTDTDNQALAGSHKAALETVIPALAEELANLKERFDLFTRKADRDSNQLAELLPSFKQIADTLAVLGLAPQRKALMDQHQKIEQWLADNQSPEQSELMAVASELLMVEAGLQSAASFGDNSDETVESAIPLDSVNAAQAAVIKECRNGLEQVKDSIISFIASQWDKEELASVPDTLRGVEGALAIVEQFARAARIVEQARLLIENRIIPSESATPDWEMMDSLADAVAGVDYYLERISSAKTDGNSVLDVAEESIKALERYNNPFDESLSEDSLGELELDSESVDMADPLGLEPLDERDADLASLDVPELDVPELDVPEMETSTDVPELEVSELDVSQDSELDLGLAPLDEGLGELEIDLEDSVLEPVADLEEPSLEVVEDDSLTEELNALDEEMPPLEISLEEDAVAELPADLPEGEEIPALEIEEETVLDYSLEDDNLELSSDDDLEALLAEGDDLPKMSQPEEVAEAASDSVPTVEDSDDDNLIDDEIIEIFIEEAEEVQETIAEFLPAYKEDANNDEARTEVRRAFHTLKGSGRMVGASEVGELAWQIENMLNRVIDKTIDISPVAFSLIDQVCEVLPAMVDAFSKQQPSGIDVQPIMDAAEKLASGEEVNLDATSVSEVNDSDVENDGAEHSGEASITEDSLSEAELNTSNDESVHNESSEADVSLRDIFESEASNHLDTLEAFIAEQGDAEQIVLTDEIQRALHTLKGSAHMASITAIADLAGECEKVVKEVRAIHLLADQTLLGQLTDATGWIRKALAEVVSDTDDIQIDLPEGWLEQLHQAMDRLPAQDFAADGDAVAVEKATPDNQMMNIFLMEGMDILGDIEQLNRDWRNEPVAQTSAHDVATEYNTLARAARMARSENFAELAEANAVFISKVGTESGVPNASFFERLDEIYERLVSLMDLLAAGQSLPDVTEQVAELEQIDIAELLDTPEESSGIEASIELDNEVISEVASLDDVALSEEPDLSEGALDVEINLDESEHEEPLDLASDDDLAALVDEFDEFGTQLEPEVIDLTEEISLSEDSSDIAVTSEPTFESSLSDDNEVDSELISIFLEEADDIVSHLDEFLDQWKSQPDDVAAVQELQRAIHTLKGGARLAEIAAVGDLCHELENLYEGVTEDKFGASDALFDLLHTAHDAIEDQIAAIHENQQPKAYPEIEQQIVAYMAGDHSAAQTSEDEQADLASLDELEALAEEASDNLVSASEAPASEPVSAPESLGSSALDVDPELIDIFLEEAEEILDSITNQLEDWSEAPENLTPVAELQRELHTLKGGARMAELSAIGDLGHELENLYEGLVEGQFNYSDELIDLLRLCHDRLADMIDQVVAKQMPVAAGDLLDAIKQYCDTGSYDADSITVTPMATLEEVAAPVIDQSEEASNELDEVLTEVTQVEETSIETETPLLEEAEFTEIELDESTLDTIEESIESTALSNDEADKEDFSAELAALDDAMEPEISDADLEALIDEDTVTEPTETQQTQEGVDFTGLGLSALDEAEFEISGVFLDEAADLAAMLDDAVYKWKQNPADETLRGDVLRFLHTMKGGAKLADLKILADQCHQLEAVIESTNYSELDFDLLHAQIDALQALVDASVADSDFRADTVTTELESELLGDTDSEDENFDASSLMDIEEEPDLSAGLDLDEMSLEGMSDDEDVPDELGLGGDVAIEKLPAPEFGPSIRQAFLEEDGRNSQEVVKVNADLLENLVNLAGETSITRGRLETEISDVGFTLDDMDATVSRLRDQLKRLDLETQAQISYRTEMQTHDYDDFDPLEMDRYTNMQQLSRSLLESVTDILDLRSTLDNKVRDAETLLLQQSRINTELQEGLMRTRMVPFSRLVPRLRRIVRQVSQELGKQVDFKVENAEGEMDRTVLDRMVAPLEHMLRNAVDHGIEMPDARKAAGKKAKGTISLTIGREGGDVVLSLRDDGNGVNLEAVRNKAIERNLMKPGSDLTDHEIMQFIFSPGFSTAKQVTQISGRGVGMDVVNSEIKQLGGNITLDSDYGKGSEFEVRLPFTVSVNRALMVKIGDDLYAVPLNTIEGIVRVSPYELEEFYREDTNMPYVYAGKEYRMEYMGTMLKSNHKPKLEGQVLPLPVLLVRGAEHPIALQVDSLMGSREVVVKSLGAQFSTVDGVSGATILGDGSVVIILDLAALIRAEQATIVDSIVAEQEEAEASSDKPVAAVKEVVDDRPLKVMVIDDSVTVRKVTSRVLQRQGYDVSTAKDGVDAIAKLQDDKPDIMLLDIEMPRMDGFEVASFVRHNDKLAEVPIIMITSRTGDKHRERAMSIGVNRYMGKPFQEAALLETIEELVGK